jgi:hypothetical protein
MGTSGARVWYFPDGYLPEKVGGGPMEAHEALMLLNPNPGLASVKLDIYFDDRDPVKDIPVEVGSERVKTLRMDHPEDLGGLRIPPLKQYAIRVRSDIPIVAQFGRVDTTQANLAYYGCMGYWAES